MKKRIIKAALILIITGIIATIGIIEVNSNSYSDKNYYYAIADGEEIEMFEKDGVYYLFLPSYLDAEDVRLSGNAKKLPADKICIMESDNIATVYINLKNGFLSEIYEDEAFTLSGEIRTVYADGREDKDLKLSSFHGRGNYSWNTWDKKSFSIGLKEENSLLGLSLGYNYALLSNASDPTLIRNDIAHGLEEAAGREYYVKGEFADLYVNGEYLGNYYLCPTVEVGKDRIDISNLEESMDAVYHKSNKNAFDSIEEDRYKAVDMEEYVEDITGGYVVEGEFVERYEAELEENKGAFVTESGECFVVKSPSYISEKQAIYLADRFDEAERAILSKESIDSVSGKRLDELVNLESIAKRYLVEEIVKNYDGGVSSEYFYKDSDLTDGRISAGPGWDYDMSLGNYLDWMDYKHESAEGLTKLKNTSTDALWYEALYDKEDYKNIVTAVYKESCEPCLAELIDKGIDEYYDRLKASATMDAVRWSSMYENFGYRTADKNEYEKLKEYISVRKAFLDKEWITE